MTRYTISVPEKIIKLINNDIKGIDIERFNYESLTAFKVNKKMSSLQKELFGEFEKKIKKDFDIENIDLTFKCLGYSIIENKLQLLYEPNARAELYLNVAYSVMNHIVDNIEPLRNNTIAIEVGIVDKNQKLPETNEQYDFRLFPGTKN